MADIKSFKLVTGEEIIGRVIEDDGHSVIIKNPRSVQLMHTQQGMAMGLMPVLNAVEDIGQITIQRLQIAYDSGNQEVSKDVLENYIKQTSGIVLQ